MTAETGCRPTTDHERIQPREDRPGFPVRTTTSADGLEPVQSNRLPWWAAALVVWSTVYALVHVYWAAGGHAGFSLLKPAATELDSWEVINAIASVVLLIPAGVALGLAFGRHRPRLRSTMLVGCLIGAAIAGSHGAYGIVYRILNVAGVVEIDGRAFELSTDAWVVWDLVLFEPWFLIEGILFAGTGWAALTTAVDRGRWLTACAAGAAAATVVGLLGVRFA